MSLTFGGCFQHYTSASVGIPIFENTTLTPGLGLADPPIAPYPRPDYENLPSCDAWYGQACGDGINGHFYCGKADPATDILGTGTQVEQGLYYNYYTETTATMSADSCEPKYGFKNVAAKKQWHGTPRYTSRDYNQSDYLAEEGGCNFHGNDALPEGVNYLTLTINAAYTLDDSMPSPVDYEGQWNQTVSVNRYSGQRTVTANSSSTAGYEYIIPVIRTAGLQAQTTITYLEELIYAAGGVYPVQWDIRGTPTVSTQTGPNGWTWEWYDPDYPTELQYKCEFDLDSHVIISDYSQKHNGSLESEQTYSVIVTTYEYTDTTFNYTSINTFHYYGAIGNVATTTVTGVLSDPYTSRQLYDDFINLLNQWDMTDDLLYPWRTNDAANTWAPLVTYNEIYSYPYIASDDETPDTTVSPDILGQPLPLGYAPYWNWKHPNWAQCFATDHWVWYIRTYGAESPAYCPAATQWVNDYDATDGVDSNFQRAFLYFDGHCLHGRKWAETFIPRPSCNYARPCGIDRFAYDSSSIYCVSGEAGNVLTLDPSGAPTDLKTNDIATVYGTSVDGMWRITRTGDYTITLNTLLVSSSQVPVDIVAESQAGAALMKARWQGDIPPICGRVEVISVDNKTPLTCSFNQELFLTDGDHIQIRDERFATHVNGVYAVTRITSASFALRNSESSSIPWKRNSLNPSYAYSLYGPHYRWNDDATKQQYQIKEWTYNHRDWQEVDRLISQKAWIDGLFTEFGVVCPYNPTPPAEIRVNQSSWGMPQGVSDFSCATETYLWNTCRPTAVYITPNGDYVGHLKAFPTDFDADGKYYSQWEASIEQWVTDPFWLAPPCPCQPNESGYGCNMGWEEDDGTCQTDTIDTMYYPQRPYVEATCEPPSGAPTLPTGVYMGCLGLSALNATTQPQGNICSGPTNLMPWLIYYKQHTCVAANGRFATEYQANGTENTYDGEEPI